MMVSAFPLRLPHGRLFWPVRWDADTGATVVDTAQGNDGNIFGAVWDVQR